MTNHDLSDEPGPLGKISSLAVVNVTTGRSRVVLADSPFLVFDLSPDGTQLAFSDCSSFCHVNVSTADGSRPRRLTGLRSDDYAPVWSPDSTALAFYRSYEVIDNSDRKQIVVLSTHGAGGATIVHGTKGKVLDLSWQPLTG